MRNDLNKIAKRAIVIDVARIDHVAAVDILHHHERSTRL